MTSQRTRTLIFIPGNWPSNRIVECRALTPRWKDDNPFLCNGLRAQRGPHVPLPCRDLGGVAFAGTAFGFLATPPQLLVQNPPHLRRPHPNAPLPLDQCRYPRQRPQCIRIAGGHRARLQQPPQLHAFGRAQLRFRTAIAGAAPTLPPSRLQPLRPTTHRLPTHTQRTGHSRLRLPLFQQPVPFAPPSFLFFRSHERKLSYTNPFVTVIRKAQ